MKVAIVHYWLVTMRGGEKVVEELCRLFPDADIYTNVYNPDKISETIKAHKIYTTKINGWPLARKMYQKYMPFMPNALMELDLTGYDLIISSESGPAKGVCPAPGAFHLCYCHTPMRYLWDMYHEYFRKSNPLVKFFMKKMIPGLRQWDVMSSNLVDHFVANSSFVAARIRRYKRADLAIEACIKSGRKIVVIGDGKSKEAKKYARSGLVIFTGRVSDEKICEYFSKAKALLFPGIEDFGIIPVEANSAGCPVLAYRKGGACDSILEGKTGLFFDEQTAESLIACMDEYEKRESDFTDRGVYTAHVQKFSKEEFDKKILQAVEERKRN